MSEEKQDYSQTLNLPKTDFPMNICDLLFKTNLAPSKSEGRRLVQGGAITFKNEKVERFDLQITAEDVGEGALLKKGKKSFIKVKAV